MFQQLPGTELNRINFIPKRVIISVDAKDASRYTSSISDPDTNVKQVKVLQLINAYRFRAQHANLDPLGLWKRERVADLDPGEAAHEKRHRRLQTESSHGRR